MVGTMCTFLVERDQHARLYFSGKVILFHTSPLTFYERCGDDVFRACDCFRASYIIVLGADCAFCSTAWFGERWITSSGRTVPLGKRRQCFAFSYYFGGNRSCAASKLDMALVRICAFFMAAGRPALCCGSFDRAGTKGNYYCRNSRCHDRASRKAYLAGFHPHSSEVRLRKNF